MHRNEILTRQQILADAWQTDENKSNKVDVYIHYLREKIDKRFGTKYIYAAKGFGYILKDE